MLSTPVLQPQYLANWTANEPLAPKSNFLLRLHLPFIANPLQGDHGPLRDGRRLLEGQICRFLSHGLFGNANILGKTTSIFRHFPKDVIPWLKLPDIFTNRFNSPGDVRTEYCAIWLSKPSDAGI
jgi:hypothetical protein